MGLAWYFAGGPALFWSPNVGHPESHSPLTVIMILLALNGAFATSYIKARAEAAGVTCNVGRMQRPERFVFLLVASALGSIPGIGLVLLKVSLALFAVRMPAAVEINSPGICDTSPSPTVRRVYAWNASLAGMFCSTIPMIIYRAGKRYRTEVVLTDLP